ncbi:hypothetical protein Taro_004700 [Colocasia esculenta]|uniref:C3H1-type domain-containing protein n=1 Tax=Colocasia esculenta TaxID=4460 RepID=A0A843TQV2_COLES|nr:hypothetical protein [Colocasia esculenta]
MMLGEGHRPSPTIHIPPWSPCDGDLAAGDDCSLPQSGVGSSGDCSPQLLGEAALAALRWFLPYNDSSFPSDDGGDDLDHPLAAAPVDAYSCDEFRMYEFKVRRCARGRSHDWTECPYAHPGEKARRRDPRRFRYSGAACPEFRKGGCRRGDACEFAHGVFECWLHPTRYRTQPCKDGTGCRRRVCFFAHTPEQLRVVPGSPPPPQQQQSPRTPAADSYDGSPLRRHRADAYAVSLFSSPASTLNSPPRSTSPSDSPPLSPSGLYSIGPASLPVASPPMDDVLLSLRQLHLGEAKSVPSSWGLQANAAVGSPRGLSVRPGFCSVPTTPTSAVVARGGLFDGWEAPAERVESGRELRARIYEKLSKKNSMERLGEEEEGGAAGAGGAPDVEWISELVQ